MEEKEYKHKDPNELFDIYHSIYEITRYDDTLNEFNHYNEFINLLSDLYNHKINDLNYLKSLEERMNHFRRVKRCSHFQCGEIEELYHPQVYELMRQSEKKIKKMQKDMCFDVMHAVYDSVSKNKFITFYPELFTFLIYLLSMEGNINNKLGDIIRYLLYSQNINDENVSLIREYADFNNINFFWPLLGTHIELFLNYNLELKNVAILIPEMFTDIIYLNLQTMYDVVHVLDLYNINWDMMIYDNSSLIDEERNISLIDYIIKQFKIRMQYNRFANANAGFSGQIFNKMAKLHNDIDIYDERYDDNEINRIAMFYFINKKEELRNELIENEFQRYNVPNDIKNKIYEYRKY